MKTVKRKTKKIRIPRPENVFGGTIIFKDDRYVFVPDEIEMQTPYYAKY